MFMRLTIMESLRGEQLNMSFDINNISYKSCHGAKVRARIYSRVLEVTQSNNLEICYWLVLCCCTDGC